MLPGDLMVQFDCEYFENVFVFYIHTYILW